MKQVPFLFAAFVFFYFGVTAIRGRGWGNEGGPRGMDISFQKNPKLGTLVGAVLILLGITVLVIGFR